MKGACPFGTEISWLHVAAWFQSPPPPHWLQDTNWKQDSCSWMWIESSWWETEPRPARRVNLHQAEVSTWGTKFWAKNLIKNKREREKYWFINRKISGTVSRAEQEPLCGKAETHSSHWAMEGSLYWRWPHSLKPQIKLEACCHERQQTRQMGTFTLRRIKEKGSCQKRLK